MLQDILTLLTSPAPPGEPPGSLPYSDLESMQYSFSISGEEIGEYGDETSATNHRLPPAVTATYTELRNRKPTDQGRVGEYVTVVISNHS